MIDTIFEDWWDFKCYGSEETRPFYQVYEIAKLAYNQGRKELEEAERDLYSLKAEYSAQRDKLADLLLEISKGQQAHIECTDRTSPTGLLIQELCNARK